MKQCVEETKPFVKVLKQADDAIAVNRLFQKLSNLLVDVFFPQSPRKIDPVETCTYRFEISGFSLFWLCRNRGAERVRLSQSVGFLLEIILLILGKGKDMIQSIRYQVSQFGVLDVLREDM